MAHKQIAFRANDELNAQLEAVARRESNQVSSVIRRLLKSALDRETDTRPPVRSPRSARER